MEFFELKNISERYLELVNPSTPEKIVLAGRVAGMGEGGRVIDFGSGYGEALILWAREFGISGLGIDIRPAACARARRSRHRAWVTGSRLCVAAGRSTSSNRTAMTWPLALEPPLFGRAGSRRQCEPCDERSHPVDG